MTNEQLTEKVIELLAYREKAQEEHETFKTTLTRLQNSMDTFTKLAEDVHIMALNMENMQKDLAKHWKSDNCKKIKQPERVAFSFKIICRWSVCKLQLLHLSGVPVLWDPSILPRYGPACQRYP